MTASSTPRRTLPLIVLLVAATACSSSTKGSTSAANNDVGATTTIAASVTTTTLASPRFATAGSYAVGRKVVTFVDASRPTDPNGKFKGAPERTLRTTIWYPAEGTPSEVPAPTADAPADTAHGKFPLILFSHGWTDWAMEYQRIEAAWASAGYVVAAPDYPLSNRSAPGGPILTDVKNQPADATFVITQVLDRNQALFNGAIDPTRIGAAGHSLGGFTTFGLAAAKCCSDPRIKAAITMAGAVGLVPGVGGFGVEPAKNYFLGAHVPLLILHGDHDELIPYQFGVKAYAAAKAPKLFVTFRNAKHQNLYIGAGDPSVEAPAVTPYPYNPPTPASAVGPIAAYFAITTAFWDRYLKNDSTAIARLRTAVAKPGSTTSLQDDLGTTG
jgi:dienelactone hydrolase